jgi:hypothetical protein
MTLWKRLAVFLCLSSALSFAASWSGALVDSKCYASEERNVNPTDTSTYVDRDKNLEIRQCAPKAKTKSFTFVDQDGLSFKLDDAGNVKAADLFQKTGKRRYYAVAITGQMSNKTIAVDSISEAK